jgi:hypothetical protein
MDGVQHEHSNVTKADSGEQCVQHIQNSSAEKQHIHAVRMEWVLESMQHPQLLRYNAHQELESAVKGVTAGVLEAPQPELYGHACCARGIMGDAQAAGLSPLHLRLSTCGGQDSMPELHSAERNKQTGRKSSQVGAATDVDGMGQVCTTSWEAIEVLMLDKHVA